MDIIDKIKILENEAEVSFPVDYIKYRNDLQNNGEFMDLYPNGIFIDSYKEIKELINSNHLSKNLFPFFVDKKAGISGGIEFDDIYCFDLEKNKPDYSVVVFSVHAEVADWKNFSDWIDWSRSKQVDFVAIKKPSL